jgi:hypothetical protein
VNDPDPEAPNTLRTEPAPPEPEIEAAQRFPWPPAAHENVIVALAETWRWSVFQPASFFRALPTSGYLSALGYFLPIAIISEALNLFWSNLFEVAGLTELLPAAFGEATPSAADRLIDFLLSPIWLPFLLFFCALVVHATLKLIGGASQPIVTTARVLSFAYGPRLFNVVPFFGSLLGGIWSLVMIVIGLREAHVTTTGRAAAAVFLPFVVLLTLLVAAGIMMLLGVLLIGAKSLSP